MADIIAQQEQVKRSPNWANHLANITGQTQEPTYTGGMAGQETLGSKEMKSRERLGMAQIAQADRSDAMRYKMHAETMALQKWSEEQKWALAWAEFDEYKRARSGGGDSVNDNPWGFIEDYGNDGNVTGYNPYGSSLGTPYVKEGSTIRGRVGTTTNSPVKTNNPVTVNTSTGKFGSGGSKSIQATGSGGWGNPITLPKLPDSTNLFNVQPQAGRGRNIGGAR